MTHDARRWTARPVLGRALDALLLLAPPAAGSAVLWGTAPLVQAWSLVPRLLAVGLPAALVAWLVARALRRAAPLATLLRWTMLFPDRAPGRLAVARLAGSPDRLRARLDSPDLDESEAARLVLALTAGLASHDRRTRGHSERVRAYTDLLSQGLGLAEQERDRLRWAALLHDIGKLEVPARVLGKPRRPSPAEWEVLQAHPHEGARLARPLLPWLGEWGAAIAQHHERFDGTGYPHGLYGDGISRAGRIIAVTDAFETMTAGRPYARARSHRSARAELVACAGSQFDPDVVRAFLAVSLPRVLLAMGPLATLLQLPFAGSLRRAGARALEVGVAAGRPALGAGAAGALLAAPATGALAAPAEAPRALPTTAAATERFVPPVSTGALDARPVTARPAVHRGSPLPPRPERASRPAAGRSPAGASDRRSEPVDERPGRSAVGRPLRAIRSALAPVALPVALPGTLRVVLPRTLRGTLPVGLRPLPWSRVARPPVLLPGSALPALRTAVARAARDADPEAPPADAAPERRADVEESADGAAAQDEASPRPSARPAASPSTSPPSSSPSASSPSASPSASPTRTSASGPGPSAAPSPAASPAASEPAPEPEQPGPAPLPPPRARAEQEPTVDRSAPPLDRASPDPTPSP